MMTVVQTTPGQLGTDFGAAVLAARCSSSRTSTIPCMMDAAMRYDIATLPDCCILNVAAATYLQRDMERP